MYAHRESLAELLQHSPGAPTRTSEFPALIQLVLVVALGAAVLFGIGHAFLTGGPLDDFPTVSTEQLS
jgi:hypothetical protein